MRRFADMSVSAFVDALASPEPTPGGGTAAAVAGAMGASLLMMVASLPKSRLNTDTERVALNETRAELMSVRERILTLADADSEAFDQVIAAYRMAKATEEDKRVRRDAIQRALRAATEAPLNTLRIAVDAMEKARVVAEHGNRSATSDVRVALELIEATAAGATANVETNLTSLADEDYRKQIASDLLDLTNRLTEDAAAARASLT